MKHFALAQMNLRSWRWTTLTAVAGLSCAFFTAGIAHGQIAAGSIPSTVSLTDAAALPVLTGTSSNTTIATNLNGEAPSSPWQVSLLSIGRSADNSGQTYQVQVTNISSATLNLPVGTDGQAIWSACQNNEIDEINIALRVEGQIAPAANLPTPHSCTAVSSSSMAIAPGASVIFTGTIPGTLLAPEGATISAVVSVCSANYSVDGSAPTMTRRCDVPAVSNSAAVSAPPSPTGGPAPVVNPVAGVK